MKKVWTPFIFVSTFSIIPACGEQNPLAFAEKDIIGVWNVLKDEFTNKNNAFETFDQLSAADTDSILFTFTENGQFEHKTIFDNSSFTFTFNYRISADTLYWVFGGFEIPYQFTFERTFDGNVLRLANDSTFYDFNDDNISEPATEVIELIKL